MEIRRTYGKRQCPATFVFEIQNEQHYSRNGQSTSLNFIGEQENTLTSHSILICSTSTKFILHTYYRSDGCIAGQDIFTGYKYKDYSVGIQ